MSDKNNDLSKEASSDDFVLTPERSSELKQRGLITSLSGAGMDEDRITEIHSSYVSQDESRRRNMEATYDVLTGKDLD